MILLTASLLGSPPSSSPSSTEQTPIVSRSRVQLADCPTLAAKELWCQNTLLARSILQLEQEAPRFQKGGKALQLLELFAKQHLPEFIPSDLDTLQKDKTTLLSYLINNIVLPLCLEGFIPVSGLTKYAHCTNLISDSFLSPPLRLIDPTLDDVIRSSLANALKNRTRPFQDYSLEDFLPIFITHPIHPYPLESLRFLDTHCSHLSYRPLLTSLVESTLETIKTLDTEHFEQNEDVCIQDYLEFLQFFTQSLLDILQIYSDAPPGPIDKALSHYDSSSPELACIKESLDANLSQVIAYLYAFNKKSIQALAQHCEASADLILPCLPYCSGIVKSFAVQKQFSYLYRPAPEGPLASLTPDTIKKSATEALAFLEKLTLELSAPLVHTPVSPQA